MSPQDFKALLKGLERIAEALEKQECACEICQAKKLSKELTKECAILGGEIEPVPPSDSPGTVIETGEDS